MHGDPASSTNMPFSMFSLRLSSAKEYFPKHCPAMCLIQMALVTSVMAVDQQALAKHFNPTMKAYWSFSFVLRHKPGEKA